MEDLIDICTVCGCDKSLTNSKDCPICGEKGNSGGNELYRKINILFKELDEQHTKSETEYLKTSSSFDLGQTTGLAKACSKLHILLSFNCNILSML